MCSKITCDGYITLNPVRVLKATELHFKCVNCMACDSYLNKAVKAELTDRSHLLQRGLERCPSPLEHQWAGCHRAGQKPR